MRKPLAFVAFLVVVLFALDSTAFCGFYVSGADTKLFNDATQVALMRDGTRTVLSMQNAYKGPPENFAMVVPVPVVLQKENVKTLKKDLFEKIDKLTAPRLVEYWEQDPCAPMVEADDTAVMGGARPRGMVVLEAEKKDLGVKVEAQFTVGEYEVVILSAKDSTGLDTWLKQEKYKIPSGAEPYLRPYVQAGSKFFVARVDVKKVKFDAEGHADLSPIRFHYDSQDFSLPVRLGLINSGGTQDLIVHVVAQGQRYEPANYPSVTVPTNFDVADGAKEKFGAFYAALFDRTLEKNPKAIVTEYAWDASTCDPCPGPTLDQNDMNALGADALPTKNLRAGWVITRMHARYNKDTLGQDIVFKAAPAISGGREVRGAGGQLEHGSQRAGANNFQGRYAIRHAWTGAVACQSPTRGIWGGPPGQGRGSTPPPPAPATKLAYAPRGTVQLATIIRSDVPELDLKAANAPVASASGASLAPSDAGGADAMPAPAMMPEQPKSGGCAGCATTRARDSGLSTMVGVACAFVIAARRRRRPWRNGSEPLV
jgi:hypothetical protein